MPAVSTVDIDVEAPCPQCGALVGVSHGTEILSCPWCGSTLRPARGPLLHRLSEVPRLDREAALASLATWFAGPSFPPGMDEAERRAKVGELHFFPFLRVRSAGRHESLPLGALPIPDILLLPGVPAELRPGSAPTDRFAGEGPRDRGSRTLVDRELLWARLDRLEGDPPSGGLLIEERAYFPVTYEWEDRHFTAVVAAASGQVLAVRRPGGPRVVRERLIVPPVAALLFAEAILLPTLAAKTAGIGLSAALILLVLRRWLGRSG
jgi:hypothetical protein